jgi:3-phytase
MKHIFKIYLLIISLLFYSCEPSKNTITLTNPMFFTEPIQDAGMDSIGFLMRKHVIVVTLKDKNEIHLYGAMDGKFKKSISREGAFPNGITTINDKFVLVTERDNKQVAVFNSSMDFLGTFGNDELRSPYGITFYKHENNSYKVIVTDSYEYNNPKEDRILSWNFTIENETFNVGPATVLGNPTLYQVESIQADKHYQTLLVAEEMKEHHKVMALDLVTGKVIKEDLGNFNRGNDPEGIALVINKDNTGYWICTEQSKTDNRFHLYDRKTLEYMTTIYLDNVSYTDGIATAYMHGKWYLYAVDNDARVVAFELPAIN